MPKKEKSYNSLLAKIVSTYNQGKKLLSPERKNEQTLKTNWNMGKFIVEVEQNGSARAQYGTGLLNQLTKDLTRECGAGFSRTNVSYMRQFYKEYEKIPPGGILTWSHYKSLMTIKTVRKRTLMEKRAIKQAFSKEELRVLVKQLNEQARNKNSDAPLLVPREGKYNLFKVITLAQGNREILRLDCGFRQHAAVPEGGAPTLQEGEHVLWNGGRSRGVHKIECGIGERYCYKGYVQRVIDGDTVSIYLQLGLGQTTTQPLRLRGVNAEELGTAAGDRKQKALAKLLPRGTEVKVLTYHHDRYNRYIADIFYNGETQFLNLELMG